ncbi:MAG: DUF4234 domain-containing protein [Treponema sp.]|nr:DUF4234 domain-containing protein [Treponema sp.]
MIKRRGLVGWILLSFITLGIYNLYWIYQLARDINRICQDDGRHTAGLLRYFFLGFITLGIYDLVWFYKLGDRLQDYAPKYGLSFKEGGSIVLLWYLMGAVIVVGPFVAVYIIIKNTNALAEAYNKTLDAEIE